jgi:hypothetical protein
MLRNLVVIIKEVGRLVGRFFQPLISLCVFSQMTTHAALHQPPDEKCNQQNLPEHFYAIWFLQKDTVDDNRVFQ